MKTGVYVTLLLTCVAAEAPGGPTFRVSFDASVRAEPATGRLVVYLIRDGSGVRGEPSMGPFFEAPQPLFGIDVSSLAPGTAAVVDDAATAFPCRPSELAPGTYRVQAVLDMARDNSSWRREPGNLWSEVATLTVAADGAGAPVDLKLTKAVQPRRAMATPGVDLFEIRSTLLSDFAGRDVMLRAGVVHPENEDPARQYGAVYEVPGFGGDWRGASAVKRSRAREQPADTGLGTNAYWIVLDPESGNGHTLFADSANNGPWGEALTTELIPALEAKYRLASLPEARILRGHSSGGWSTLWLALTYPGVFGACFSSSPDPVDFRRFQLVDIYGQAGMYTDASGADLASMRTNGRVTMTIRQENLGEEVLGPDNTSGQQWDSWMAVFGPRNARGHPAALYDPLTGALDRAIAEQYRRYDIGELVRNDPARFGPIFRERIRLVVGSEDSYYLNEAVALLKPLVEGLPDGTGRPHGYINIVPGDHGSVFGSEALRAYPAQMLEHLRRHGLAPK